MIICGSAWSAGTGQIPRSRESRCYLAELKYLLLPGRARGELGTFPGTLRILPCSPHCNQPSATSCCGTGAAPRLCPGSLQTLVSPKPHRVAQHSPKCTELGGGATINNNHTDHLSCATPRSGTCTLASRMEAQAVLSSPGKDWLDSPNKYQINRASSSSQVLAGCAETPGVPGAAQSGSSSSSSCSFSWLVVTMWSSCFMYRSRSCMKWGMRAFSSTPNFFRRFTSS